MLMPRRRGAGEVPASALVLWPDGVSALIVIDPSSRCGRPHLGSGAYSPTRASSGISLAGDARSQKCPNAALSLFACIPGARCPEHALAARLCAPASDIQIPGEARIFLDILEAQLRFSAHQGGDEVLGPPGFVRLFGIAAAGQLNAH